MLNRTTQFQLFLLVLISGFLLGPYVLTAVGNLPTQTVAATEEVPVESEAPVSESAPISAPNIPVDPFADIRLTAKSAYVWDVNTHRKLYAKNAETRLSLASVTKVMMALTATELLSQNATVTVAAIDLAEEGDTGLYAGELWAFEKLLAFTLVASSNDGASAIASAGAQAIGERTPTGAPADKGLFIAKMNEKARAIGLTQTTFQNESGLDMGNRSGGYGSARDIAMLFEYVLRKHPAILAPTAFPSMELTSLHGFTHTIANTNQDVSRIPGMIGSKTGYTDLAGGNLAVVVDIGINRPVVIVVLGSTREDRFRDVERLIAATTKAIANPSN